MHEYIKDINVNNTFFSSMLGLKSLWFSTKEKWKIGRNFQDMYKIFLHNMQKKVGEISF